MSEWRPFWNESQIPRCRVDWHGPQSDPCQDFNPSIHTCLLVPILQAFVKFYKATFWLVVDHLSQYFLNWQLTYWISNMLELALGFCKWGCSSLFSRMTQANMFATFRKVKKSCWQFHVTSPCLENKKQGVFLSKLYWIHKLKQCDFFFEWYKTNFQTLLSFLLYCVIPGILGELIGKHFALEEYQLCFCTMGIICNK